MINIPIVLLSSFIFFNIIALQFLDKGSFLVKGTTFDDIDPNLMQTDWKLPYYTLYPICKENKLFLTKSHHLN